jgi:predicted ATPase
LRVVRAAASHFCKRRSAYQQSFGGQGGTSAGVATLLLRLKYAGEAVETEPPTDITPARIREERTTVKRMRNTFEKLLQEDKL